VKNGKEPIKEVAETGSASNQYHSFMIKASNCTRRKEGSSNCAFHKKEKEKRKNGKSSSRATYFYLSIQGHELNSYVSNNNCLPRQQESSLDYLCRGLMILSERDPPFFFPAVLQVKMIMINTEER
jgi:hypothetical protein